MLSVILFRVSVSDIYNVDAPQSQNAKTGSWRMRPAAGLTHDDPGSYAVSPAASLSSMHASQALAYLEPMTARKFIMRSRRGGRAPVGAPEARSSPPSSTSMNFVKPSGSSAAVPGHQTSLNAMRLRNCTCATSCGGSLLAPMRQVLQEPPGPTSSRLAMRMPSPSGFRKAMPSTRPSFSLSASCTSIVVRSQWFQSLKACPV
mmetsp:Transcript_18232/g.55689  ORF Transcript_18232/g.55689 Transcript_18232/m.55689 type:complete len:203 (-) Transcript_18232:130-738(-)